MQTKQLGRSVSNTKFNRLNTYLKQFTAQQAMPRAKQPPAPSMPGGIGARAFF